MARVNCGRTLSLSRVGYNSQVPKVVYSRIVPRLRCTSSAKINIIFQKIYKHPVRNRSGRHEFLLSSSSSCQYHYRYQIRRLRHRRVGVEKCLSVGKFSRPVELKRGQNDGTFPLPNPCRISAQPNDYRFIARLLDLDKLGR